MAEENVMAEIMNLLEAEPSAALPAPLPAADIPALREQLAILVSTGKCKEAIAVNLTHEQVWRLEEKDVMKHCKRPMLAPRQLKHRLIAFCHFLRKQLAWLCD